MISKKDIKLLHSLKLKKYRDEHSLFVAEGVKIVNELLQSDIPVKIVFAVKNFIQQLPSYTANIEIIEVTETELKKISSLTTPNQVLAVAAYPEVNIRKVDFSSQLCLVLDNVQDPGNLGTIIRIADWFGIEHIVCSPTSVDAYNPKVVQATMGSIFRINIHYTDLETFLKSHAGHTTPIYGALLEGKNIYKEKLAVSGLIVLGNESKGISKELLPYITRKISIPSLNQNKSNGAESLNVAIAAAILCSEFRKNGV